MDWKQGLVRFRFKKPPGEEVFRQTECACLWRSFFSSLGLEPRGAVRASERTTGLRSWSDRRAPWRQSLVWLAMNSANTPLSSIGQLPNEI